MIEQLWQNEVFWAAVGFISVAIFIAMIVLTPWLVGCIPHDYFVNDKYIQHKPANLLEWCIFLFKNLLGIVLLLLGVIMLFTPGQGMITILLALVVMQFPGKRTLEKRIISNPKVLSVLNWLRAKNAKPKLKI